MSLPIGPPPRDPEQRIAWLEQLVYLLQEALNEKDRQLTDHETRITALEP